MRAAFSCSAAAALGLVLLASSSSAAPVVGGRRGGAGRGSAPSAPSASSAAGKPHVVLLMMDDVGWADVGYHGSNFPTPNIDALATEGVRLERMYAYSQCSPTRSASLTGQYTHKMGTQHWNTMVPTSEAAIPLESPTLAEELRAAGYETHMAGKWHLGFATAANTPTGRGFDSFVGMLNGAGEYYNRTFPACQPNPTGVGPDAVPLFRGLDCDASPYGPLGAAYDFVGADGETDYAGFGEYTENTYIERLEELIEAHGPSDPPMFLYYAPQLLHAPIEAPPEPEFIENCRGVSRPDDVAGNNRTELCSMASKLDYNVGRLVAALKAAGMYENTLFWGLSDNGGMTAWTDDFLGGYGSSISSNHPLRGSKATMFEGGIRSVSWIAGGAIPAAVAGSSYDEPIHVTDIVPTVLGLAGLTSSNPTELDGRDVWAAVTAGGAVEPSRGEIVLNCDALPGLVYPDARPDRARLSNALSMSGILAWPWKLLVGRPSYVIPADKWGYWTIEDYQFSPPPPSDEDPNVEFRLFNLEDDEAETMNLAADRPDVVARLNRRLLWHRQPRNGWQMAQTNVPQAAGNPANRNWTWTVLDA